MLIRRELPCHRSSLVAVRDPSPLWLFRARFIRLSETLSHKPSFTVLLLRLNAPLRHRQASAVTWIFMTYQLWRTERWTRRPCPGASYQDAEAPWDVSVLTQHFSLLCWAHSANEAICRRTFVVNRTDATQVQRRQLYYTAHDKPGASHLKDRSSPGRFPRGIFVRHSVRTSLTSLLSSDPNSISSSDSSGE